MEYITYLIDMGHVWLLQLIASSGGQKKHSDHVLSCPQVLFKQALFRNSVGLYTYSTEYQDHYYYNYYYCYYSFFDIAINLILAPLDKPPFG